AALQAMILSAGTRGQGGFKKCLAEAARLWTAGTCPRFSCTVGREESGSEPCGCNNWPTKSYLKLAKRGHCCELAPLVDGHWKWFSADRPKFKRQFFVTIETGNGRENFVQR